ncbi:MAG: type II toxin-antitoxin system RelE/ParE family toxin [Azospirillaceae bacterium]
MRVYATRWFGRFARRQGLSADRLLAAVAEIDAGLVDAELGGGLVKKRVAKAGRGRSSGYRTIVAVRQGEIAIFVYGFEKSSKASLSGDETRTYRDLAGVLLGYDEVALAQAAKAGALRYVGMTERT